LTARSTEFFSAQGKPSTAIYNGFFACDREGKPKIITVAPPIQIFHPAFQELLDRINDPDFEPDQELIALVLRLLPIASQIHLNEDDALRPLRPILSGLLGGYMSKTMSEGRANPDGIILKQEPTRQIPLVLLEYKRSLGEGGCDPSVQAALSLLKFLYQDEVSALHPVPSF
jgi:hypothetical protein